MVAHWQVPAATSMSTSNQLATQGTVATANLEGDTHAFADVDSPKTEFTPGVTDLRTADVMAIQTTAFKVPGSWVHRDMVSRRAGYTSATAAMRSDYVRNRAKMTLRNGASLPSSR